jgi:hypothetical protein
VPLPLDNPGPCGDRFWWKLFFLFAIAITAGVSFSFAGTVPLSGESVSGSWHQGLSFTGVDFGPVTVQANASSGPVLVGYLNVDPSQWHFGEEDFWGVGVHYSVNGVAQAQGTLFDSEPEVICLTPSCSDSTPDQWAIDSYLNPGPINTPSGQIIASLVEQGVFEGGGMLIPASNGAQQYAVYYQFTLIAEPSSVALMCAGIAAILAIAWSHRLALPPNIRVR